MFGKAEADPVGNTLEALDLKIADLIGEVAATFPQKLRAEVTALKEARLEYYRRRHRETAPASGHYRGLLGIAGVIAIILGAMAPVARTLEVANMAPWQATHLDLVLYALAAVVFAAMSAITFLQRGTDTNGTYFRSLAAMTAIRDLWTGYQFDELRRSLEAVFPDTNQEKLRWVEPARAFAVAIDAIAQGEFGEWKSAWLTSTTELADFVKQGSQSTLTALTDAATAAAQAARDAAAKAEKASEDALAVKAPATLNLSLGKGAAGHAEVFLDGKLVGKQDIRDFALTLLPQGEHLIRISFTPTGGAGTTLERAVILNAGINELTLAVP